MKKLSIFQIVWISTFFIIVLGACSSGAATVNTDEIVAQVRAEVQAQMQEETPKIPVLFQESNEILAEGLQVSLIEVYQIANPSVVFIINPVGASGSGFVFDSEGYIVTNNHVIEGASRFEIVFANGERLSAELTGVDVDSDLAVLKVEALPGDVKPLSLAPSEKIQVGQFVVAIGNPFGEQGSMSFGIISGLGRSLISQRTLSSGSSYSLPQVIQTDAPINPGNSGGPLLSLAGEVVGVNAAIDSQTGENTGVGFSIPVAAIAKIVPVLIDEGEYVYPYLGVGFDGEVSLAEQELYGVQQTQGAYVVSIVQDSPGELAGLKAAAASTGRDGDLIVAIDGQPVNNFGDLNSYLVFQTSVGQSIELTVLRNGERVSLDLTLGARP